MSRSRNSEVLGKAKRIRIAAQVRRTIWIRSVFIDFSDYIDAAAAEMYGRYHLSKICVKERFHFRGGLFFVRTLNGNAYGVTAFYTHTHYRHKLRGNSCFAALFKSSRILSLSSRADLRVWREFLPRP